MALLGFRNKVTLATLIFKIKFQLAPLCIEFIIKRRSTTHNLRKANNLAIPFSNSYYMKNSVTYRVPLIWNPLLPVARCREIKAFTKISLGNLQILESRNFRPNRPTPHSIRTQILYTCE